MRNLVLEKEMTISTEQSSSDSQTHSSALANTNAPSGITEENWFRTNILHTKSHILPWNTTTITTTTHDTHENTNDTRGEHSNSVEDDLRKTKSQEEMIFDQEQASKSGSCGDDNHVDPLHLPQMSTPMSVIGNHAHGSTSSSSSYHTMKIHHTLPPSLDDATFHPKTKTQGKSPSSVIDSKPNNTTVTTTTNPSSSSSSSKNHSTVASSPLILTPKIQKVLTPITSKLDQIQHGSSSNMMNDDSSHHKSSLDGYSNITSKHIMVESGKEKGPQHPKSPTITDHYSHSTPKRPYVSVSDGTFLSPFLPSPEHKSSGLAKHSSLVDSSHISTTPLKNTLTPSDFGKNDLSDGSTFDGQYMLPWLSPLASGLFQLPSGDVSNITPTAGIHQTPQVTKLISASYTYGQDYSLALPFEKMTSQNNANICISPLTRRITAMANDVGSETPINFHEVFASPNPEFSSYNNRLKHNDIPEISYGDENDANSSSAREHGGPLNKSLAELKSREDEDLSILLKLAETTPRRKSDHPTTNTNSRVFRGKGFVYPAPHIPPSSSLHLPFIGGKPMKGQSALSRGEKEKSVTRKVTAVMSSKKETTSSSQKKRKLNHETGVQVEKLPPKATGSTSSRASTASFLSYPHQPAPIYPPPPTYMPPGLNAKRSAPTPYTHTHSVNVPQIATENIYKTPTTIKSSTDTKGNSALSSVAKKDAKGSVVAASVATKRSLPATPSQKAKSNRTFETPKSTKGRGPGKKPKSPKTPTRSPQKSEDAELLRGVTQRPSGKWQAQMYFKGKSRYIGVFDTREKAAIAYEIARDHLKRESIEDTDDQVDAARKAAFAAVGEKDPRDREEKAVSNSNMHKKYISK